LHLTYYEAISNFDFNFNLRRYSELICEMDTEQVNTYDTLMPNKVERCRSKLVFAGTEYDFVLLGPTPSDIRN